jgi:hypothetical protein
MADALAHPNRDVRAWAVRLFADISPRRGAGVSPPSPRETSARDARAANTATLLRLAETEADSHVRSQLASTAKRLPGRGRAR